MSEVIITAVASALGSGGLVALLKGRWGNEALLRRELRDAIETYRVRTEHLEAQMAELQATLVAEREARIQAERTRDEQAHELADAVQKIGALDKHIAELETILLRDIERRAEEKKI